MANSCRWFLKNGIYSQTEEDLVAAVYLLA